MKPILCVDFDGVLHSYASGWKGARNIPDPPVDGAMEFLDEAQEYFQVNVYSSRSRQFGGKRAMKKWLLTYLEEYICKKYSYDHFDELLDPFNPEQYSHTALAKDILSYIKFPTEKPAAFLTIDDRCFLFRGTFPYPKELLEFKPWTKKEV